MSRSRYYPGRRAKALRPARVRDAGDVVEYEDVPDGDYTTHEAWIGALMARARHKHAPVGRERKQDMMADRIALRLGVRLSRFVSGGWIATFRGSQMWFASPNDDRIHAWKARLAAREAIYEAAVAIMTSLSTG